MTRRYVCLHFKTAIGLLIAVRGLQDDMHACISGLATGWFNTDHRLNFTILIIDRECVLVDIFECLAFSL